MRIFYEPTTLAIVVAGVAVAGAAAGSVAAVRQSQAARQDVKTQEKRDVRDERVNRRRLLARQRAALAAQGVDLEDAGGLLTETRTESLLREGRTQVDSRRRRDSFRRQGAQQATSTAFSGFSRAGQSLLAGGVV